MQGIYNCIPETNHVVMIYSVAAVLNLNTYSTCNVTAHDECFALHISTFISISEVFTIIIIIITFIIVNSLQKYFINYLHLFVIYPIPKCTQLIGIHHQIKGK